MKIYSDKTGYEKLKNTCVTIGTFDGVHKGHRDILSVLKNIAKEKKLQSTVVTFYPHPRSVVSKNYDLKILTTIEEKEKILAELGIDNLYIINFTEKFAELTSAEFIEKFIVDNLDAKYVVIGYDHRFGKDRGGGEDDMRELGKKYGFDVTSVSPVDFNGTTISSTKIRNALLEGEVDKANAYLGWNYSLSGKVVEGAKRGRILGFRTANLQLSNPDKLIPATGVYAVHCSLNGEKLSGVMNIGYRPTFEDDKLLVIEVHLLNFDRDIYGENLSVDFITRIRAEKKFASKDELINQIEEDKLKAAKLLKIEITN